MSTNTTDTYAASYDAGYAAGISGAPIPAGLRGNHAAECGYDAGETVYLQRDAAGVSGRRISGEVFVRVGLHALRLMNRGEDPQSFFSGAYQAARAADVSACDAEALYAWANTDCAHPETRDNLLHAVDIIARMHRIHIDWEAELLSPPKAN